MIVKRNGGMTEFIPSPREKREGLVRDHVFDLIDILHARLKRLEDANNIYSADSEKCHKLLMKIRTEESNGVQINRHISGQTIKQR